MKKPLRLPSFLRAAGQTGKLAAWQTGRLFRKAAQSALDAVQDVLRAEVVRGNGELVREFVMGRALPVARTLLLERMAARLLLRLGLRGALASNVVGWILPLVVEQLLRAGRKSALFEQVSQHATVQDTLQRLAELRAATWQRLAPATARGTKCCQVAAPFPRGGRLNLRPKWFQTQFWRAGFPPQLYSFHALFAAFQEIRPLKADRTSAHMQPPFTLAAGDSTRFPPICPALRNRYRAVRYLPSADPCTPARLARIVEWAEYLLDTWSAESWPEALHAAQPLPCRAAGLGGRRPPRNRPRGYGSRPHLAPPAGEPHHHYAAGRASTVFFL